MITSPEEFRQQLLEIQNSVNVIYSTLPSDEPRFIIDANSRTINIPIEFQFLGVKNDHNAETIYFEIDRYFDDEDLSQHTCVVQFSNKNNSNDGGIYPVTTMDTTSVDGKIIFGWEIKSDVTSIVGDIYFSVRFYSINSTDYVFTYNFNTLTAKSSILDTHNVDNKTVIENYPSELDAWLERMNELEAGTSGKVEEIEAKGQEVLTEINSVKDSIPKDYSTLSSDVSELKGDLGQSITNNSNEFISNARYIKNNLIIANNSVIDLHTTTNNDCDCAVIPCSPADRFNIMGYSADSARVFCFIDKNNNALLKASPYEFFNGIVTAPDNASALIINRVHGHAHSVKRLNDSNYFDFNLIQESENRLSTGTLLSKYYKDFIGKAFVFSDFDIECLVQIAPDGASWINIDSELVWTQSNIFAQQVNRANYEYFRVLFRKTDNSSLSKDDVKLLVARKLENSFKQITISAHNANESSKLFSDFVCTGKNDEQIFKLATFLLPMGGTIKLSEGDFYIDNFYVARDGLFPTAILFQNTTQEYITYNIEGVGIPIAIQNESNAFTKIKISDSCYDNLDDNQRVGVFRAEKDARIKFNIKNIGLHAKSNNKPVAYICGAGSLNICLEDVRIWNDDYNSLPVPNTKCIGVWGTYGSNPGVSYDWKKVFVFGCHEGFRCMGEHLILWQCGARTCTYGYTFGAIPYSGTNTHPITLINCCDELNTNLPYFGIDATVESEYDKNTRQAISFIDYNIEWVERLSPVGTRHYAMEYAPNRFIGSIEYSIQPEYGYFENAKTVPFWAEGHGIGFKSRNQAHQLAGTSAERRSYSNSNSANYMQTYFDTDLNKMLVFDGTGWKDFNGNSVV